MENLGEGGGGIYTCRYSPTFCIFIILDIQACEKEYLLDRAFENNVMFTILLLFSSPKKEYKKITIMQKINYTELFVIFVMFNKRQYKID